VDFALDWIIGNVVKRFDGRVKSIGILPHVIGEALGDRAAFEKKKSRTERVNEDGKAQQKSEAERKEIEGRLRRMPKQEQEELRQVAVAGLMQQGIPQRFLLEAMVTAEMCRLLQEGITSAKG
jgi:hypothetical protein